MSSKWQVILVTVLVFLIVDIASYLILGEPSLYNYNFQAGWVIAMMIWIDKRNVYPFGLGK